MTNLPSPATAFEERHGEVQEGMSNIFPRLPNELPVPSLAFPTTTVFPSYNYLNETLGLPISINFTPFECHVQEEPLPPRCKRCKAYLQEPFQLMGNSFICGVCGRENNDLPGLERVAANPVEFICEESMYEPASVDSQGVEGQLLSPGEVSHVTSEVLCHRDVHRGGFSAMLQERDLRGARDGALPSTQRYSERKVRQLVIEEIGTVESEIEDVSHAVVEKQAIVYKFIHIFVVEVTFNSIYQSVLATVLALIDDFLSDCHENIQVGIVFSMMNTICFAHSEGRVEIYEVTCDPTTGEPVIPVPLDHICFDRSHHSEFKPYSKKILEHFYKEAEEFPELMRVASVTTGETLAGVISSLERTGGIVNFVLTDRISMGLGEILPEEQSAYQYTTSENCLLSKEAPYYCKNLYYNRLAREAAAHNVSVNIVCLPHRRASYGLMQLSPLVYLTGGSLYYNEPALLISSIQETGNDIFLRDAVLEIFETEGIACFFTLRCSRGIDMCLYENEQIEEIDGVIESSKKLLKTVFKEKEKTDAQLKNIDYYTKDKVYGCFEKVSDVELTFASLKRTSSFHVGLRLQNAKFENPLTEFALLYTGQDGRRHVRVFTLQLEASDVAARIYNAADEFSITAYLAKQMAARLLYCEALENGDSEPFKGYHNSKAALTESSAEDKTVVEAVKNGYLSENEVEMLGDFSMNVIKEDIRQQKFLMFQDGGYCLKRHFSLYSEVMGNLKTMLKGFSMIAGKENQKDKLLIPQPLQLLPLYFHSLGRSELCVRGRESNEGGIVSADQRIASAMYWLQEDSRRICNSLVCGIFDIGRMMEERRAISADSAYVPLPPTSYAVKDLFSGIYLFVSSCFCYLSIGRSCNEQMLTDLLGPADEQKNVVYCFSDPAMDTLLEGVRHIYQFKGGVYVCSENSELEGARRWMMVMDGFSQSVGYSEFLQNLPTMIK